MYILLKSIAGSRLYGTNRPDSDTDIRGVCIEPINSLFGLEHFEQVELSDPDMVIYGLRKFARLALQNNPNILDTLFTPKEYWIEHHPLWHVMHDNRHMFLSQRVRHTYAGYAQSQLHRIKQHRYWLFNPQPEDKRYQEWITNRNPARLALEQQYGYDTKHGSHLVRLLLQVRNILHHKDFNPVLSGMDKWFVLQVLRGDIIYDDLILWADIVFNEIKTTETGLPEEPNTDHISQLLLNIYRVRMHEWMS